MTANHPAEAVDPLLVEKESREGEEVNEEVMNKVIADFKGLYNREPTDDELQEALTARAGTADFVPLHRDFKDHKGATEG